MFHNNRFWFFFRCKLFCEWKRLHLLRGCECVCRAFTINIFIILFIPAYRIYNQNLNEFYGKPFLRTDLDEEKFDGVSLFCVRAMYTMCLCMVSFEIADFQINPERRLQLLSTIAAAAAAAIAVTVLCIYYYFVFFLHIFLVKWLSIWFGCIFRF